MAWRNRVSTKWVLLILSVILLKLAASSSFFIEKYYASGFYPLVSRLQRLLLGWIPFSMGDILYIVAGLGVLWFIYRAFQYLRSNGKSGRRLAMGIANFTSIIVFIYLIFNILWGLNYNRQSPAARFNLEVQDSASASELASISEILLQKSNSNRPKKMMGFEEASKHAIQLFQNQGPVYVIPSSIKPSLFGTFGNYMGYSGYYNPFSGEAQVNTTVPGFLIPFVICHEMAHQAGFAKENEANFAGFLAGRKSLDSSMLYSIYFNMFLYANGQLRRVDSVQARRFYEKLSPGSLADLAAYRMFLKKYDSPLGSFIDVFYDRYLRLNQQPAGSMTYNKVVLWLLAYYKKNGEL
jgi:hypothetical protein